jgi:predicted dehydrogenase
MHRGMEKLRVGLVGCGNISGIYAKNLPGFADVELVACTDLDWARAEEAKEKYGLPRALPIEEFFEDPEIQVVLNLTIPAAHAEIGLRALDAGKSVYHEKPLAVRRREARQMLGLARERGLRIGCAPDTFLGAGLQTCRKLIDDGAIGRPVAATAFMLCPGHESWHPNPQFYYEKGAGPLFDMGPYYLTALTALLGPVQAVQAAATISFPERTISSQPLAGQTISVRTPTHHSLSLEFAAGALGTMITSFDVVQHGLPNIEIYGEEGSLRVPDPNTFGGPVLLATRANKEWREVPLEFGYAENSRGIGLADMARAMQTGRDHRCNERLAFHVLEIMHTALDSAEAGRKIEVPSTMTRPEPLPVGLPTGRVDL